MFVVRKEAGTDPAKDSMHRACRRGQGLPSDLPKDSLCLHLVVIDCKFVVRAVFGMTLPKTACPGHAIELDAHLPKVTEIRLHASHGTQECSASFQACVGLCFRRVVTQRGRLPSLIFCLEISTCVACSRCNQVLCFPSLFSLAPPTPHHKAKGGCWDLLWCTYSCWIFSLCCWHLLWATYSFGSSACVAEICCEPRTAFRSSACVAEICCEPRTALDLQPVMLPSCLLSFFFRPFESSRS